MANEIVKMRSIRSNIEITRVSLKNREKANKCLREQITPIWTLEKEKRTKELDELTNCLVDGRKKVREYQETLREAKHQLKATNRDYDLSKGE